MKSRGILMVSSIQKNKSCRRFRQAKIVSNWRGICSSVHSSVLSNSWLSESLNQKERVPWICFQETSPKEMSSFDSSVFGWISVFIKHGGFLSHRATFNFYHLFTGFSMKPSIKNWGVSPRILPNHQLRSTQHIKDSSPLYRWMIKPHSNSHQKIASEFPGNENHVENHEVSLSSPLKSP